MKWQIEATTKNGSKLYIPLSDLVGGIDEMLNDPKIVSIVMMRYQ